MPIDPKLLPAQIALNRFGLGARAGETPPADPRGWLRAQFDTFEVRPAGFAALADAGDLVAAYQADQRAARLAAKPAAGGAAPAATPTPAAIIPSQTTPPVPATPAMPVMPAAATAALPPGAALAALRMRDPMQIALRQDFAADVQALYRAAVQARMQSALATPAPFVERLVHFWSNHFCVSADNPQTTAFVGAFERDAIRPYVLGRYADMLMAVEQHPAMLIYLNQIISVGPNSPAALRAKGRHVGLNENLAREIMELHTLGVRTGYGQADVTEFARAMTGWSVSATGYGSKPEEGATNNFRFRPQQHEPGVRTILGKHYAEPGVEQARAALVDFAAAPATATHIATKLARHFAGDAPPPALVQRLATAFTRSGGELSTVYAVLIDSPEPWVRQPVKFKTPWEWTVSALRGLGRTDLGQMQVAGILGQLGQPVWKPGSPAGYDDVGASWAAPDALLRRVEFAQRLVAPVGDRLDARALGPKLIPASLSVPTQEQVARAESPGAALALLLVSPDFLRR